MDDFHFVVSTKGNRDPVKTKAFFLWIFAYLAYRFYYYTGAGFLSVRIVGPLLAITVLLVLLGGKTATRVAVDNHELVVRIRNRDVNINVHEIYTAQNRVPGKLVLKDDEGRTLFIVGRNYTNMAQFLQYLERSGVELPG